MNKQTFLLQLKKLKRSSYKNDTLIGIAAGIILAAIFVAVQLDGQVVNARQSVTIPEIAQDVPTPNIPLTIVSSPDEVIALMLNSHTRWQTIQANAITTFSSSSWQTNIQLEQYGKGRGDFGAVDLEPEFSWISDGDTLWQVNLTEKTYEEISLPEDIKSLESFGPSSLPTDEAHTYIVGHPLESTFPSILSPFFFPHGLAQSISHWQVEVIGFDTIAGRDTIILLAQVFDDEGQLIKKHEYWIDTSTGLILQSQTYSEATGWDEWYEQTTITDIAYNVEFSADTFEFVPAPDLKNVPSGS